MSSAPGSAVQHLLRDGRRAAGPDLIRELALDASCTSRPAPQTRGFVRSDEEDVPQNEVLVGSHQHVLITAIDFNVSPASGLELVERLAVGDITVTGPTSAVTRFCALIALAGVGGAGDEVQLQMRQRVERILRIPQDLRGFPSRLTNNVADQALAIALLLTLLHVANQQEVLNRIWQRFLAGEVSRDMFGRLLVSTTDVVVGNSDHDEHVRALAAFGKRTSGDPVEP